MILFKPIIKYLVILVSIGITSITYADPNMPTIVGCYNVSGCSSIFDLQESILFSSQSSFSEVAPSGSLFLLNSNPLTSFAQGVKTELSGFNDVPVGSWLVKNITLSISDAIGYKMLGSNGLVELNGTLFEYTNILPIIVVPKLYRDNQQIINDSPNTTWLLWNILAVNKNALPSELQSLITTNIIIAMKEIAIIFDKKGFETFSPSGNFTYNGSGASINLTNLFNDYGVKKISIIDNPSGSALSSTISTLSTEFNSFNSRILKISRRVFGVEM